MASRIPKSKVKYVVRSSSSNNNNGESGDNNSSGSSSEGNTTADIGLTLEKLNLGPRKKLLILSLGGLLIRRVHLIEDLPGNPRPDFVCGKYRVFKRPFCDEFLKFCFERFEVAMWSAAKEYNIDTALHTVMGGFRRKLLFIWYQEKCTDSGFQSLEKADKPIFLKDLKKVWENKLYVGKYSSSNTLLIDEEPYKALLNPPNSAIFTKKYRLENGNDTLLAPKGKLQSYLDGLADASSVPCYVKENPFGQPAITPSHPEYGYYSRIIRLVH